MLACSHYELAGLFTWFPILVYSVGVLIFANKHETQSPDENMISFSGF